jgi:hypothetical protein
MSEQIDARDDQPLDLSQNRDQQQDDAEVRLGALVAKLEQIPFDFNALSLEELIFVINQILPLLTLEQLDTLCHLVHRNNIVNRFF